MTVTSRMLPHVRVASLRRHFSSTARRLETYGFIGLGQMGYQMAKNLQSKLPPSDTIRIFDINKDAMQRLARDMEASQAGGAAVELAESVAKISEGADTVITVLPEPSHVKSVYASILPSLSPSNHAVAPAAMSTSTSSGKQDSHRKGATVFIDCSTIDPSTSKSVAASVEAASSGASTFVDAPMSGGVVGAAAGTLTFMLGSPASAVGLVDSTVEPVLLRMGRRVLRCGGQGAGLSAKLANNYLLAVSNVATAEAMNLGMRWGLDPAVLAGVINASTGRCWPSEVNNPVPGVAEGSPAGRGYEGGFGVALMRKDLGLAIVAAGEAGARLELAEAARRVYEGAEADERCKGRDFSVVYRWLGGKE